jgi:hypothetical protein
MIAKVWSDLVKLRESNRTCKNKKIVIFPIQIDLDTDIVTLGMFYPTSPKLIKEFKTKKSF